LIEVLLLLFHPLADLGSKVVEAIQLIILTNILYLVSVFLVLKSPSSGRQQVSLRFVLATAILFRITVWPLYPALSDDPYRYRWEGKIQAARGDPYQSRPIDARWESIRDATFPKVGSKDFKSAYGPLIELLERFTYQGLQRFTKDPFVQVFWFKLPAALFDLGIIGVLVFLLGQHRMPLKLVLIYAWSPLPIMEFWATGHNDSIEIFFVLLALLMAARSRWIWSFTSLSLAVAAKIWPILLFPAFIFSPGGGKPRWYQWLVLFPVLASTAAPYLGNVTENAQFLSGFVGGWRNNDSLFGAILWYSGGDLYRAKYTAVAIIAVITLVLAISVRSLEKATLWTIVAMLLVSANCHPWYLTWFAPLLVFYPYAPLLLWSALMPLSYAVLLNWLNLGMWDGSTSMRWFVYAPFFTLAIALGCSHWVLRRR
jgi:alpha-1,6-mannosyltransferase